MLTKIELKSFEKRVNFLTYYNVKGYNMSRGSENKMENFIMENGFGKYLKEYLEFYHISQSEFASRLGITQKHMNEILNGKKEITIEMAVVIESLTKIPLDFIINAEHRKRVTRELLEIYGDKKALEKDIKDRFPIKELDEKEWITFKDITNIVQIYMDLMEFLKVKDFKALEKVQEKTLFKKTGKDLNKLNLWIARCDELSREQEVKEYNSINFSFLMQDLKELSYKDGINIEEIQKILNCYGIYFVVEKALNGTKVRGCFKVKLKNPAIYITKNYSSKDSFFFELYHELGHCKSDYNEAKSKVFIEGSKEQEERADNFAIKQMVPEDVWNEIIKDTKEKSLLRISEKYKVPMSFIVGRLAKLNHINYEGKLYNKYRMK